MAAKIRMSKDELAQRDDIASRLRSAFDEIEDSVINLNREMESAKEDLENAIDEYNIRIGDAKAILQDRIDEYNALLAEARQFVEGVASQAELNMSERSERWLESEKGEAAQSWIDTLLDADFGEIDIDLPDEIEVEFPCEIDVDNMADDVQTIEDLPEEPDEM